MKKEIYPLTYTLEDNYWWYVARRKIIIDQLIAQIHKEKRSKKPTILDFGCGTGINLVHFSRIFDAYGLDFSKDALHFCKKRGLKNVRLFRIEKNNGTNPFLVKFDFITLLDVLEHFENEKPYLTLFSNWLNDSGILFLTVPAYQWVWSGEDYVSNHFRRFTKKKLADTLEKLGFRIIKISYFNFFLFPLQMVIVFINKFFSPDSQKKSNLQEFPKIINTILEKVMGFESLLLNKFSFPFGGSIFCVCKKREKNGDR